MDMHQDGVRAYCLLDGAKFLADDEGRRPQDLDECPCGYDICSADCTWYVERRSDEQE